jgi:hypothetical protein
MAKKDVKYFSLERELAKKHFRVAIFGSARIKRSSKDYKEVFNLSKMLGMDGIDVVSGGGPGIMEAANRGHEEGKREARRKETHSFGLTIKLPEEQRDNRHFDMKKDFQKFSARLDYFIELSNAVVVAQGGVGTLLEFLYTWQLIQVEKIRGMPIILLGEQWPPLVEWIKKGPLKHHLLSEEDLNSIYIVKNSKDAYKILKTAYDAFERAREILTK